MKSLILFLLFSLSVEAKITLTYSGTVRSCNDGDTCRVDVNGKTMKVRLSGIDAPELNQPEGTDSKRYLEGLVRNKEASLKCDGMSFDRVTCTVFLGNKNINEDLVRNGYAWDSPKFSNGAYQTLMVEAQTKKLGIWKTITVSPYCFRHKKAKKCRNNPLWMN